MEEMVERVARALAAADDEVFGPETPFFCDYPGMARVAIAAMREPTAGMVAASRWSLADVPQSKFMELELSGARYAMADFKATRRWRAMIDAALGKKGDG